MPFPYGYALGRPEDPEFQHRVLKALLELLRSKTGPVLAEFPETAGALVQLIQASAVKNINTGDPAAELTLMRGYYEQWLEDHAGRTAVGNSGILSRRFRSLVRYLEAYLQSEPFEFADRPPDVGEIQFLRYAADDLKAFMLEARMQQRPSDRDNALQEWFWGETAVGALLVRVARKLKDQGEDRASFGIAR